MTETPTETPTVTPTETPTPTPTPVTNSGYPFILLDLPYTFPSSGNAIMNNSGGATMGITKINELGLTGRGFYLNSIDADGVDRSSYFQSFLNQGVTISFTQDGNTAIYSGDTQSFKSWSFTASGTGFVFGSNIGVPPSGSPSGQATIVQSSTSDFSFGEPVYISLGGVEIVTPTPTNTPTNTETPNVSPSETPTETPTPTNTPTNTETPNVSPGETPTETPTPTNTPTNTETPNVSPGETPTETPTPTNTPTNTETPGASPPETPTETPTPTNTPTNTETPNVSPGETPTETPTPTNTPTNTETPNVSPGETPTETPTPTNTPTNTETPNVSPGETSTETPTPTNTPTTTPTETPTPTITPSSTNTSEICGTVSGTINVLFLGDANVNTVASNINSFINTEGFSITYSTVSMSTTYSGSGLTSSGYDVVVIYTNGSQVGASGLSDSLLEFVNSGGHIISGVFLWNLYTSGFTHSSLTPFLATDTQSTIGGNFTFSTSISIADGLNSTFGGTPFTNGNPTLSSGAVLHASYTPSGVKLLAIKEVGCSKLIGINTWFGSITSNTSTLCKMLGRSILYSVGQLPQYEPSPSSTPSSTPTSTITPSVTPSITVTQTPDSTSTPTPTNTPTPSGTPTITTSTTTTEPSGCIYYFSDRGTTNEISDGGDDMYDDANLLYANGQQINYTHTQLDTDDEEEQLYSNFIYDGVVFTGASSSYFGPSSSYFTNLYPGLFVLAARGINIGTFSIDGDIGADGGGEVDGYNFQTSHSSGVHQTFVKRVWDAGDPSINHMIIVNAATSSTITQYFPNGTNDDTHIVSGLGSQGVSNLYYLLSAKSAGIKITNNEITQMVGAFLNISASSSSISDLLSNLNTRFTEITGVLNSDCHEPEPTPTNTPTPTSTTTPTPTPTPTPSPEVTTTTSTTTQVVPITTLPPNQPSSDTYSGGNKQFASTYGSKPMGLKIPIQPRTRSRRFFRG